MLDHLVENNVRSAETEVGEGSCWTASLDCRFVWGQSAIYWWKTVRYPKTPSSLHFSNIFQSLNGTRSCGQFLCCGPKNTILNVLLSPGLLTATEGNSALSQASLFQLRPGCKLAFYWLPATLSPIAAQCQIVLGCGQRRKIFNLRMTSIQESFIPSRFFQPQISTNISRGNIR